MSLSMVATCSVIPIIAYWWIFRTIFNPVSLYCSSFTTTIGFAYYLNFLAQTRDLHAEFRSDPNTVAMIYGLGIVSFIIPWLSAPSWRLVTTYNRSFARSYVIDIVGFNRWTGYWSVMASILLITCFMLLGSVPIVSMLRGDYTIAEHIENIKQLPLGLMALMLLCTFMLILHTASMSVWRSAYRVDIRLLLWIYLILAISATWQGNRQVMLIIIFFLVARWSVKTSEGKRPPVSKIVRQWVIGFLILCFFVSFFIVIGRIRHTATGTVLPLELLAYFSWPVDNMLSIVDSGHFGGRLAPHYLLTEMLPSRLGGKDQVIEMGQYLFEPTSPSGYLSYWFLDFGYAGIALGALALSVFSRWAFRRSRRSEVDMRIYMLALWCCATAGIYNHFLSLHYFILPLILLTVERWFFGRRKYVTGLRRGVARGHVNI